MLPVWPLAPELWRPAKPPAGRVLRLAKDSSGPRLRLDLCLSARISADTKIGLMRQADSLTVFTASGCQLAGCAPRCVIQAPRHLAYLTAPAASALSRCANRVAGGAEEIRTPDLRRAKEVLSQLSYGPFLTRRDPCSLTVQGAVLALPSCLDAGLRALRQPPCLHAVAGGPWWTRTTDLGLIRTAL